MSDPFMGNRVARAIYDALADEVHSQEEALRLAFKIFRALRAAKVLK
jgi:hypothetical protein